MTYPPNFYNPYDLQDLYEDYITSSKIYPIFRDTFQSFEQFFKAYKKNKPNSIIYRNAIRIEERKYHSFYN